MTLLFDIGASHMRLALATDDGIGSLEKVRTPEDPEEAVRVFTETAQKLGSYDRAVGGVAGIVLPDGSLTGATNLPEWNGFPLRESLGDNITLYNDAELNGLGEATYGAGKGKTTVGYLGLGTGIGTSLIVNGQIVEHSSDGAMRERIVELSDDTNLEMHVGGRALTEEFGRSPKDLPHTITQERTHYVVEAVRTMIEAWTPDVVVIGGSLLNPTTAFSIEEIRQGVGGGIPVVQGTLGDASGLWGARALV